MESGFVTRTGEEILIEEQIEMEFETKKKLFSCCKAKKNGITFIIVTNQRIAIIKRIELSNGDNSSDCTYVVPHQILNYGFSTSGSRLGFCCCKTNLSGYRFFFTAADGSEYSLGAESREQLDKIAEAMYLLTSK